MQRAKGEESSTERVGAESTSEDLVEVAEAMVGIPRTGAIPILGDSGRQADRT